MQSKNSSMEQRKTLGKVFHYMKRYIPLLVLSIIFAAISVILTLYFPILTGQAIDQIIGKDQEAYDAIQKIVVKALFVIGATAVVQWLMNVCNNRMTYGIVRDIR